MENNHNHTITKSKAGTVDSEIVGNYATFLNAAKEMLGRDLKVTTGGGAKSIGHLKWQKYINKAKKYYGVTQAEVDAGSKKSKSGNTINQSLIHRAAKMMSNKDAELEYRRGALDIGMVSNKLTNEEALNLGKLALKHEIRVIEEDDHLHLDSRQHSYPLAPMVDHVDRSERTNVTPTMSAQSIAREKALKQFLIDEEKANIEFNKEAMEYREIGAKEYARKQFLSNIANLKF